MLPLYILGNISTFLEPPYLPPQPACYTTDSRTSRGALTAFPHLSPPAASINAPKATLYNHSRLVWFNDD